MIEEKDSSLEAWFEKDDDMPGYLTYEQAKYFHDNLGYEPLINAALGIYQIDNEDGEKLTKYYPIWDVTHLRDGMYPTIKYQEAIEFLRTNHKVLVTYGPRNFASWISSNNPNLDILPIIYFENEEGRYQHYSEHPRITPSMDVEIMGKFDGKVSSIEEVLRQGVDLAIIFLEAIKTKKKFI